MYLRLNVSRLLHCFDELSSALTYNTHCHRAVQSLDGTAERADTLSCLIEKKEMLSFPPDYIRLGSGCPESRTQGLTDTLGLW